MFSASTLLELCHAESELVEIANMAREASLSSFVGAFEIVAEVRQSSLSDADLQRNILPGMCRPPPCEVEIRILLSGVDASV